MAFNFEYSVTRPYPFRFFTAFVIIFFLIATVLLSLFNTIITGYNLHVSYSTNPNGTIAEKMWYDKPAFAGINKLSPSCEAKEMGARQQFNTNKNGFIYTLNNIRNVGDMLPSPSMLYLNNTLEDCAINYIKIEVAKHLGRTAQQVAWQRFGPQLLAAVSCSIRNAQGHMRFNFTTEYDLVPPVANKRFGTDDGGSDNWKYAAEQNLFQFVISNNTQDPAMWWAESLMSYGWLDAALKMEKADDKWQSGSINFWPSEKTSNISSTDFFNSFFYILLDSGSIFYSGGLIRLNASSDSPLDRMTYASDILAKSFYSAVLTDLGSSGSNILADEAALRHYTSSFKSINSTLVSSGPATDSYDALKGGPGKPVITPSTIYTTYLCQTPERKLTSALIVSVLLANLVLLRALWTIMSLIAVHFAKASDPGANECMRCATYKAIPLDDRDHSMLKTAVASEQPLRSPYSSY